MAAPASNNRAGRSFSANRLGGTLALPDLCLKLPDHPSQIGAWKPLVFREEIGQRRLDRAFMGANLDGVLAARDMPDTLRARASVLATSELLTHHAAYFEAGAPRR